MFLFLAFCLVNFTRGGGVSATGVLYDCMCRCLASALSKRRLHGRSLLCLRVKTRYSGYCDCCACRYSSLVTSPGNSGR